MLELPSPNRLTCIRSSDHILKYAFAGIFVYVVYLCFDLGFQFVYFGWLVEVHPIFQVCPQKEVRRSQIGTSRWPVPFDMIRSSKNSVRTFIVFLAV